MPFSSMIRSLFSLCASLFAICYLAFLLSCHHIDFLQSLIRKIAPTELFFCSFSVISWLRKKSILISFHILHVFYDHQCDLEGDGIFKYPQIQPCTLL